MSGPDYSQRVAGVRAALPGAEVDALLVTNLVNVRYLTGYTGSNGLVLVDGAGATFLTDFRYVTAAEPISEFMSVRMLDGDTPKFVGANLADMSPGSRRIGIEAPHLSVASHAKLASELGGDFELAPTTDVVETLRLTKDSYELDAVRRSAALVAPVYEALAAEGMSGKREVDIAWRIRELFHEAGADDLSFDPIVASHERGAMPHADPGPAVISAGTLVTIDLGCYLDGYASDCTRTFAVGEPDADLRRDLRDLPRGAGGIARRRAPRCRRPRGRCGRPRRSSPQRVTASTSATASATASGSPSTRARGCRRAPTATLEPGMVVTVEPGIYLPGRGGVRIEDLVIVTETGGERLTSYTKELQRVA